MLAGSALMFFVLLVGPFAWLLRDGLGPDSTDSTKLEALSRMFWTFYWGPVTCSLGLIFLVAALLRKRLVLAMRSPG